MELKRWTAVELFSVPIISILSMIFSHSFRMQYCPSAYLSISLYLYIIPILLITI